MHALHLCFQAAVQYSNQRPVQPAEAHATQVSSMRDLQYPFITVQDLGTRLPS